MKITRAIFIFFLSMILQVSFIRFLDIGVISPNLPLISLFLIAFFMPLDRLLPVLLLSGLIIDSVSSLSFGATSVALFAAFLINVFLREKVIKGRGFVDLLANCFLTFFIFYLTLGAANVVLKSAFSFSYFGAIMNLKILYEILLNVMLVSLSFYFIKYYKNNYGRYGSA